MKDKWFSYGSFKFTKAQIKWALANITTLRNGTWPSSHKESGYIGQAHSKQVSTEGNFVKAASIAAELDIRIQMAGCKGDRIHDGLLMEMLYLTEPEDEIFIINHMAQSHGINAEEIYQRIRNALYFVAGAGRKTTTYSQYLRDNHKTLML